MNMPRTQIQPGDIMDVEAYGAIRKQRRAEMVAMKKNRRLAVGPHAMLYFENYDTMLYQVHEMVFTERGGQAQIAEELEAYNPLIPQGNELVATLMMEIVDTVERDRLLRRLGGIEETVSLEFGGEKIMASWECDVDRTTPEGKTSSVHFLHFRFSGAQAAKFRDKSIQAAVAIAHKEYAHSAVIPAQMRDELVRDLG